MIAYTRNIFFLPFTDLFLGTLIILNFYISDTNKILSFIYLESDKIN